jgi:carbonic anhydrase/acetyltransferase-like protein (isoleucine patch superfamily)
MSIIPYQGRTPVIHPSVFIAEGAHIIGDVEIGKGSSVWFNTVIRGDVNFIRIGERTNVQDNSVLHVTHKTFPLVIGSNVTIGHSAVLHAATIFDFCLIGMNATVLDDAKVGPYALVAAGAVVLGGTVIPEGMLAAGIPAKIVRKLTQEERKFLEQSAENYMRYVVSYKS